MILSILLRVDSAELDNILEGIVNLLAIFWSPWTLVILGAVWITALYKKKWEIQIFMKELSTTEEKFWETEKILPVIEQMHHSFWEISLTSFCKQNREITRLRDFAGQGEVRLDYLLATPIAILRHCETEQFKERVFSSMNTYLGSDWLMVAIKNAVTSKLHCPMNLYMELRRVESVVIFKNTDIAHPITHPLVIHSMAQANSELLELVERNTKVFLSEGKPLFDSSDKGIPEMYDELIPLLEKEKRLSAYCNKVFKETLENALTLYLQQLKDSVVREPEQVTVAIEPNQGNGDNLSS